MKEEKRRDDDGGDDEKGVFFCTEVEFAWKGETATS